MNRPTTATRVGVRFDGSVRYADQYLFKQLSFELPAARWTCLLGRSGVGKSTLLRLLAGLATGGEFSGQIVATDRQPLLGRTAYMAQSDLLLPWLNVRQNVMVGQRLRGEVGDGARADALIEQVGLRQHATKRPHQLSGGMRQRTALARTLMEDTPVVLLDEPFAALDAQTRADMQALAFRTLRGRTVLLVTHEPAEAVRLAHRLYLMAGQIALAPTEAAACGVMATLKQHNLIPTEPLRRVDAADTLKAQADLLLALQAAG